MAYLSSPNPLVHFVFIHRMSITPKLISIRLSWEQIDHLKSLRGSAQTAYIYELTGISASRSLDVSHIDWMVSSVYNTREVSCHAS